MLRFHKSGSSLSTALLVMVAGLLSACGGGGGSTFAPAPNPFLTVTPSALDFQTVRVGTSSSKTVSVTNSGTGTLSISQATLTGSGFSFSGLQLPLSLAAGQNVSFNVAFAPTTAGGASGALSLSSNAAVPVTTIGLSGTGATYQLKVGASSLNFGNVALGSNSTQLVSLSNSGTATLTISQISAAPGVFSLKGPSLPATLGPGQSTSVSVIFSPTATAAESGSLSIISDASDSPAAISLAGTGVTYHLSVSPSSLNFGNVTVASTSTQTVTLTNSGTASLTVSQASVTGTGFSLSGLYLPLTLAAGESAGLNVIFAPSAAGSVAGSVSVVSSASASPVTVALSALGVNYQLTPSLSSLGFGSVGVSLKSIQTITLTNTGTGEVTISQITLSGTAFTLTALNLPAALTPGQSVTLTITFSPSAAGSAAGTLSVISNASGSPMTISLTGTGATYQLTSSASSLNFGNVAVASSSAQTIIISDSGTASVTISQISVVGPGFSVKSVSLPMTLETGQSVSLSTSFSPTSIGSASGTISVFSNASGSPLVVPLTGTGVTYQLTSSPASLSFGNVAIGQSAILPVALTSTGTASVTISQVSAAGSGLTVSSPGLPLTLGSGQSTSVSVTFAPTAAGSVTGALSVTSNATGSPLTEALSGTGIHCVDLTWTASTSTGVSGYNVYRSQASSGPYNVINTSPIAGTSFVDESITAGQTYYYMTTAIGEDGAESGYSNVASVTVPTP